jgi:hypothetical protein
MSQSGNETVVGDINQQFSFVAVAVYAVFDPICPDSDSALRNNFSPRIATF